MVGNNGSGKTVLMKCICGFMKCDRGRIFVDGRQVGKEVDFPDRLGVIIETPGFIPNLSGYKNLKILASLKGRIGKKEIRETMERVGLNPDMKKPVAKYSLGMRQRLGIAQAIMEDPGVLILDEPFNGLDRYGVVEIRTPSYWVGKTLKELDVRRSHEVNVVGIKEGDRVEITPNPDVPLTEDMILMLIGSNETLEKL